ncbi:MAG: flagellar P-ring protein precursor FlgI [Kiritimatiellia bacterium]|jgi:flagellar P-ring protein precursor FlgI
MKALLLLMLSSMFSPTMAEAARAKDLGAFFGVRDTQLSGVGLVTGLQQTGDTQINRATVQAIRNRLQGQGLIVPTSDILSRNAALVSVTATLRTDARIGQRLTVTVASIGDARSLEGGVLQTSLMFHLSDPTDPYALAQGSLVVGGFSVESDGNQARSNTTNSATVPFGATLEREIDVGIDFNKLETIDFVLAEPDFTTAERLADAVNDFFKQAIAEPDSASTVRIEIPVIWRGRFARFASRINQVELSPDVTARVVINSRTGTVVMGGNITIEPFAIAHGGLKIEVKVERGVSQPAPFSQGTTETVQNTFIGVNEEEGRLVLVQAVSLSDLVTALNTMDVKPRDLITILQAVHDAGALHAELVVQ